MWKTLGGFTAQISRFQHIFPLSTAQINCSGSDLPFFRKPYFDAEFILNTGGRNWFLEYIDITLDSSGKMLSFQNIHTKHRWTKADLAKRLGVLEKPRMMSTSQLSSGFILLGNTGSNGDLVRERKKVAVERNYHYSDGYSF
jgi:hypothetical protein